MKKPPGEFELIARLVRGLRMSRRTVAGPGDDCAILAPSRSRQLFTIDSMLEDVHFRPEWGPPEKLGARSLAVNLSDIAAMGGRPTACVVNLAVRPGLDMPFFDRLYAGMRSLAREAKVDIVGGNVTRADKLGITMALLGEAGTKVMRRDTARPGDEIFVTGTLGDSAVGVRILSGQIRATGKAGRALVERHLSPTARLAAGMALARMRPVPAAIDISDGLMQDLGHVLKRSRVGAEIDAGDVPTSAEYRAVMGDDMSLALGGGEDYELLFCVRPGRSEVELARRLGVPVRRIGAIVRGRKVLVRGARGGVSAQIRGWDQLRGKL